MRDHEQLAMFHRSLAEFCRMGMPLGNAFREVAKDLAGGRLAAEAGAMAAEVEGGASLGDAWRKRSSLFPPVYAALVEAGAASGDLPGTLEEIARHAALRADAAARMRRALAYPVILLVAVSAISWFLFEFVVPQFAVIFSQIVDRRGNPMELPALTRLVLAFSGRGLLVLPAVVVLFLAAGLVRRPMEGIGMPLGLSLRLPVIGPLRLRAELLTFTHVLGGMVRRGLPAERALDLAAEVVEAPALRRAASAAAGRVRGGAGLAASLKAEGVFPPTLLWLVAAAERRGEAAGGLAEVADLLALRVEGSFERILWTVVPSVTAAVGFLVFVVVLAVFYPILRLQSALM